MIVCDNTFVGVFLCYLRLARWKFYKGEALRVLILSVYCFKFCSLRAYAFNYPGTIPLRSFVGNSSLNKVCFGEFPQGFPKFFWSQIPRDYWGLSGGLVRLREICERTLNVKGWTFNGSLVGQWETKGLGKLRLWRKTFPGFGKPNLGGWYHLGKFVNPKVWKGKSPWS